jgi:carbamoyl-phosphate synthase large subunit
VVSTKNPNKEMHSVLVTGIGGGGVGEQILKALLMSEKKFRLVGTDSSKISANSKLVDKFYQVPRADDPQYLYKILDICEKEDIKTFFYGNEPELKILSANRELFEQSDIYLPLNPKSVIEMCMNKNELGKWLHENNFSFIDSIKVEKISDIELINFFPCVVKPAIGSGGSAHVYICQSTSELNSIVTMLLKLGIKLIAQRYVGDLESEYTVGVLHDESGQFVNSIAVRRFVSSSLGARFRVKNLDLKNGHGEFLGISSGISQGEIGKFSHVTEVCEKIALKLGCTASINFQCRVENNQVYIFEINPRFSGTTSLRALVGFNEPRILIGIKHFSEHYKANFSFKEGIILRSLSETFIPL